MEQEKSVSKDKIQKAKYIDLHDSDGWRLGNSQFFPSCSHAPYSQLLPWKWSGLKALFIKTNLLLIGYMDDILETEYKIFYSQYIVILMILKSLKKHGRVTAH